VSATKGIVKEKQTDETERNTVEINFTAVHEECRQTLT